MAEQNNMIRISGVEYEQPVGKRIELLPDGRTNKTPLLEPRGGAGKAINKSFAKAGAYFDYVENATAHQMFFAGTFKESVPDGAALLVPDSAVSDARRHFEAGDMPTIVSATKEYLAFREGSGVLRVDIDAKARSEVAAIWPEDGAFRVETADEAIDALLEICPEASECPMFAYPSSSSMIFDEEAGELKRGPGGWRIHVIVDDAREIPRILEVLHLRCWALAKYRFAFVSRGGACLFRSYFDQALGRPTQPDYPRADLGPGLAKAPDAAVSCKEDGPYLVGSSIQIEPAMQAQALQYMAEAREALKSRAEAVVAERKREDVQAAVKRGVPKEVAERGADRKFDAGVLLGSDVVSFLEGGEVPVSALLSPGGEQYDGRVCFDPVEPDYDGGRAVGRFYWNDGLRPGIHSFAHGSKFYALKHDAATAGGAITTGGTSSKLMARVLAMLDADPVEERQLEGQAAKALGLGNARAPFRAAIEELRKRMAAYRREHEAEPVAVGDTNPASLKEPLDRSSFPMVARTATGPKLLDHQDNVAHMLERYGIEYRYNVIRKDFDWSHPEIATGDGDNDELSLFSVLTSLCALNGVPSKNLGLHLVGLGARDEYNPVVDYLSALAWDGARRFDKLADTMGADDPQIARLVIRMFLIQVCASADYCAAIKETHPDYRHHYEGILVLVGGQGAGKTKGLRKLFPRRLRRWFKEGLILDPKNKDSVKAAVSCWVAELGELDATFKKSDIATLKAFMSRQEDEMRLPYAPKFSFFRRRTAFAGTVNDTSFLADETGNRRFWPLTVSHVDISWSDEEIDQLWAEAWTRYVAGEKWWPSREEELLLADNAERYRYKSPLQEAVENTFDWSGEPDWASGRRTAAQIYQMVETSFVRAPDASAMKTIGETVRRLWLRSLHARIVDGVLSAEHPEGSTVRLNSDDGKKRGWYLPPRRVSRAAGATGRLIDMKSEREKRGV